MSDKYKVTITIESSEGYKVTVTLEDCPRDALIAMPNIGPAVLLLEESVQS